jgi:hypothetical protein
VWQLLGAIALVLVCAGLCAAAGLAAAGGWAAAEPWGYATQLAAAGGDCAVLAGF